MASTDAPRQRASKSARASPAAAIGAPPRLRVSCVRDPPRKDLETSRTCGWFDPPRKDLETSRTCGWFNWWTTADFNWWLLRLRRLRPTPALGVSLSPPPPRARPARPPGPPGPPARPARPARVGRQIPQACPPAVAWGGRDAVCHYQGFRFPKT
jgi:hypothetical protein